MQLRASTYQQTTYRRLEGAEIHLPDVQNKVEFVSEIPTFASALPRHSARGTKAIRIELLPPEMFHV
ncbi:MAG: hypothetical protein ACI9HK_006188 [Pirellulaceae bacterium]|jgi:hypothetical protein